MFIGNPIIFFTSRLQWAISMNTIRMLTIVSVVNVVVNTRKHAVKC